LRLYGQHGRNEFSAQLWRKVKISSASMRQGLAVLLAR
jgi:hypothetical protein